MTSQSDNKSVSHLGFASILIIPSLFHYFYNKFFCKFSYFTKPISSVPTTPCSKSFPNLTKFLSISKTEYFLITIYLKSTNKKYIWFSFSFFSSILLKSWLSLTRIYSSDTFILCAKQILLRIETFENNLYPNFRWDNKNHLFEEKRNSYPGRGNRLSDPIGSDGIL